MVAEPPKTVGETRSRMHAVVRDFRAQAAGARVDKRRWLADRARRDIERLYKLFKHKIDDMLRLDTKRRSGLNERERLGLEEQLRLAREEAIERLEQAIQNLGSGGHAEQSPAADRPRD